jgi:hypothetical protein
VRCGRQLLGDPPLHRLVIDCGNELLQLNPTQDLDCGQLAQPSWHCRYVHGQQQLAAIGADLRGQRNRHIHLPLFPSRRAGSQ